MMTKIYLRVQTDLKLTAVGIVLAHMAAVIGTRVREKREGGKECSTESIPHTHCVDMQEAEAAVDHGCRHGPVCSAYHLD